MAGRRRKNLMIISLCLVLVFMGIGYALLSRTLLIGGTTKVTGKWKVYIESVTPTDIGGDAVSRNTVFSNDRKTATFTADLYDVGDYVEYTVVVKNDGNIAAKLDKTETKVNNASEYVKFTTTAEKGVIVKPNSTITFTAKVYINNPSGSVMEDKEGIQFILNLDFVQAEEVKVDDAPVTSDVLFTKNMGATSDDTVSYTYYNDGRIIVSGEGNIKDYNESVFFTNDFYLTPIQFQIPLMYIVNSKAGMKEEDLFCETTSNNLNICDLYFYTEYRMLGAISESDFLDVLYELRVNEADKQWLIGVVNSFPGYKSLEIRDGVTSIGTYAFSTLNTTDSTVTIPDTVSVIKQGAFYGTQFKQINLPNNPSFTEIPEQFCYFCKKLESLTVPNSVTVIKNEAFRGHEKLESVDLGNSLITVEDYAFCSISGILREITLPASLVNVYEHSFTDLTSVTLDGGDTTRFDATWNSKFSSATKIVK